MSEQYRPDQAGNRDTSVEDLQENIRQLLDNLKTGISERNNEDAEISSDVSVAKVAADTVRIIERSLSVLDNVREGAATSDTDNLRKSIQEILEQMEKLEAQVLGLSRQDDLTEETEELIAAKRAEQKGQQLSTLSAEEEVQQGIAEEERQLFDGRPFVEEGQLTEDNKAILLKALVKALQFAKTNLQEARSNLVRWSRSRVTGDDTKE